MSFGDIRQYNEPGCMISSVVAEFDAMTIRTGLSYCLNHVKQSEIMEKIKDKTVPAN